MSAKKTRKKASRKTAGSKASRSRKGAAAGREAHNREAAELLSMNGAIALLKTTRPTISPRGNRKVPGGRPAPRRPADRYKSVHRPADRKNAVR
ncbi:MAG: hypothetical protein ACYTAN_17235 [Planctomycetota bacterium]